MRSDYNTLRHFHVQSFSDQENYLNNPSVLGGSLANILPEHLGIWSVGIPLLSGKSAEILDTPEYKASLADGEQTIFSMTGGLCGNLFMSGRFDKADDNNFALIKEAIALYKKEQSHIHNSYPIWPLGFTRINDKDTWSALGLENENRDRILLAVWRLEAYDDTCVIPLPEYAKDFEVRQIYPAADDYRVEYKMNKANHTLSVRLPKRNTARYFEIRSK